MASPRILTFNFHEPYLCLMAKTGYPFTVGLYDKPPFAREWQTKFRPVPPNITFVPESVWRRELEAGRYDVVIAHNELNAASVFDAPVPGILVCHNRLSFLKTTVQGDKAQAIASLWRLLNKLREKFAFVFISESKRDDYGIPGRVILPGIDVEAYGGYRGDVAQVLRVGNAMRSRNLMFDVGFQEEVCQGLPNRVVGEDPLMPFAQPSKSFEDLLDKFRSFRCLLHVTREEWEDGYNLAMLEAMACGMPVVALANETSPLTNGEDGFVSMSAETLRQRLKELLDDRALARDIGAKGRETVAKTFPLSAFVDKWRHAIEEAAEKSARSTRSTRPTPTRRKVLLEYVASPITTARYFDQALRRDHQVVTTGWRCPERLLKEWGFSSPIPPYSAHALHLEPEELPGPRLERARRLIDPDVYLWVDSGVKHVPSDLAAFKGAKACYLIDTHLDIETRLAVARHFDHVFLAQKAQVPAFVGAGLRDVTWLPLACSKELHDLAPEPRTLDVAYVGSLSDEDSRRRDLIGGLKERYPNSYVGRAWPHDMAAIYHRARIVVNACVNRDVNMRVFEALASGALLITDEADGLEDLFVDGTHLVIYRDDRELHDLIDHYLDDSEARERIAAAGRTEVLAAHTYDHRVAAMLEHIAEAQTVGDGYSGESRFQSGGYYRSSRPELVQHVPRDAARVLDCGCGAGDFGRALKERGAKEVVGIEVVERAWELADKVLDKAILGSIETVELPFDDGYFDCICFGDVLEHLVDPAATLKRVSRVLSQRGVIVASIPNARFCHVVQMLAHGRWKYEDAGIMDRTHLRFFTAIEMEQLFQDAGLDVLRLQPLSMLTPDQLPRNTDGSLTLGRMTMRDVSDLEYQDFRTFQYLVIAGKPGVHRLEAAQRALDENDNEKAFGLAEASTGGDAFLRHRIMGKALARLGKLDTAVDHYRQALALRPADGPVTCELGLVLIGMGRYNEARDLLESAVTADGENDRALGGLGLIELAEGRPMAALERFRQSLDVNFDNASILAHVVETSRELGLAGEAEPYLRRYVDFYPGNVDMSIRYAMLLHHLGRTDEARDRLEMLLMLAPGHREALDLLSAWNGERNETGA